MLARLLPGDPLRRQDLRHPPRERPDLPGRGLRRSPRMGPRDDGLYGRPRPAPDLVRDARGASASGRRVGARAGSRGKERPPVTRDQLQALAKRLHHEVLYGHDGVAGVELRLREALAEELEGISSFFRGMAEQGLQPTLREVADELTRRGLEYVPWQDEEKGRSG